MKIRKKPVVVEAVRWTGDNLDEVQALAGGDFQPVDPEDRTDDPDITGEVYDKFHSTWIGVKDNQYIIRGVENEFYPCDADVLWKTYEVAE